MHFVATSLVTFSLLGPVPPQQPTPDGNDDTQDGAKDPGTDNGDATRDEKDKAPKSRAPKGKSQDKAKRPEPRPQR